MTTEMSKERKMCGGITILCFVTVAALCGLSGLFSCTTVKFPAKSGDNGQLDAGLFRYRTKAFYYLQGDDTVYVSDTCVAYGILSDNGFDYVLDKKAEALQGLAIAIGVIGGVFAILSCVIPCVPGCPNKIWQFTGLIFLITGIMQGCTLMLLDSSICTNNPVVQYLNEFIPIAHGLLADPTQCQTSSGYNMIITATVFWIVAGLMTAVFPPPTCFPDDMGADDVPSDQPPAALGDGDGKDVEVPEETHKDDNNDEK